jgi:conjugative relaxase-like TrwC/TraI family protein
LALSLSGWVVLTLTALTDGEYLLSSVALGIDEYYAGVGEAPGVWAAAWSAELGVEGMVEADQLRALIDGSHPVTGEALVVGLRERSVKAFDLTFSAPKSVSLLWALGSEPIADTVMGAHREAVGVALGFLEERVATARMQVDGVRRHVATRGWAVAGFVHRTSREGDPQLHTHCLVPNVVCREPDGRCVALAARPLFVWARAAGSVYQAELQRVLSLRLGVEWGPDRSNTRDLVGFTTAQLRLFSKRTVEIEAELETRGGRYESPASRMRADDVASLATRPAKDHSLTPTLLVDRWHAEAAGVGLDVGRTLDGAVCWRDPGLPVLGYDAIVDVLVDEESGLCARAAKFAEPDVVEHLAALSSGRLTVDELGAVTARFLESEHVVRLMPARSASGWEPARWSTTAHRALEDEVLALLDSVQERPGAPIPTATITAARLGVDQKQAVDVLCGAGASVRVVLAPAGYGKTAMIYAAAAAAIADGRRVVAVATTAKAVAELTDAGLPALTIARFRLDLHKGSLEPNTVVVLDEVSQTSTGDAHTVLTAVADCVGGQLWVLGDPHQAPSVKAGGIAAELDTRARARVIPAATLTVNRRQVDPVDRHALTLLRAGDPAAAQAERAGHGWEHDAGTPAATHAAMADAVVADIVAHGCESTVALVVSHGQAEDLADRIRRRLTTAGRLSGPTLTGPGWTSDRAYQAGDRILFHTRHGDRDSVVVNGTVATVTAVDRQSLTVRTDRRLVVVVAAGFVGGVRADGTPNLSHAWARTVDGAQGGTWDHAHLLGSAALDAYRGYTGQSRSRHPTHTWNTAPVDAGDHGGRLADQRTAHENVAAALARVPDTTMAAVDDPWTLDRHFRTTIASHGAVLDRQPPDRTGELAAARHAAAVAHAELVAAERRLAKTSTDLDRLGPLRSLGRAGRAERRHLEGRVGADQDAVIAAGGVMSGAEHRVARLEHDQHRHDDFERAEGWRRDALDAAADALDAHWTAVALSCCRGDDPLAFGVGPLRLARQRLTSQLVDLDACLPADLDAERRDAQTRLAALVAERRSAQQAVGAATNQHERLARQRWPRRDPSSIGVAADHLHHAHDRLDRARHTETDAVARLEELDAHQDERRRALHATAPQRAEVIGDLALIDTSLEQTRPERVLAAIDRPEPWQVELLGPVPASLAARAVWCDAAHRIETHLDCHTGGQRAWRQVCSVVADTPELCAVADDYLKRDTPATRVHQWAHLAQQARDVRDQLLIDSTRACLDHRVDRDLGIEIDM